MELAKLIGSQISKRAVWSHLVILSSPALNDHACSGQGRKEFAIETLVAKLIVKALYISLLPGRARLDVQALNLSCAHPLLDRLSDELRAVVAADVFGLTVAFDRPIQDPDGIQRSNGSAHFYHQTLLGVFIDESQDTQRASRLGLIVNDVPTPDLIGSLSSVASCRRDSNPSGRSLLLAHLQAFLTPNPLHTLGIDPLAFPTQ